MPDSSQRDTSGLFYQKTGSGPVIVLLHGFPGSGNLWHNIVGELSVLYTVIVPDLPGSGNSALGGATSIDDMAVMVRAIVEKEQTGQVVIAGHSMGGYVALSYAKLYADSVAGLSLVHSTTAADDEEKKNTRRKSIELIQKGGRPQFINQMVPNLFSPTFKQSASETVKKQVDRSQEIKDEALVNFYQAMMNRNDTTDLLPGAPFPVQWVAGLDDTVIPVKKILDKCHKSDVNFVSFYNNCGHMSMLEAPEKLVADLSEFSSFCFNRQGKS